MTVNTTVFVLGASGYIGGSVLVGFKSKYPDFEYTALVRKEEDAEKLKAIGVTPVIGDHSQLDKIQKYAAGSDIAYNGADADDLNLTKAILAGLKWRYESTKKRPILIHTSGTGVAQDNAEGDFREERPLYNDNVEDDIKSIPPDAIHRNVDLAIFNADTEGYVSAYIVAPATIYGTGIGPIRNISQQIPNLIRLALDAGQASYVGPGTNVWPNVHILDLVELYNLVLEHALTVKEQESSYAKFYWGAAGQHLWSDIVKNIGKILYEKGKIKSAEAKSVPNPGGMLASTATNSRVRADRGFNLGWKPKQPSVLETLNEDIELTLKGY